MRIKPELPAWFHDNDVSNDDLQQEAETSEVSWFKEELEKSEANLTVNQKHHRRASLRLGRAGLIPRNQRHRY